MSAAERRRVEGVFIRELESIAVTEAVRLNALGGVWVDTNDDSANRCVATTAYLHT